MNFRNQLKSHLPIVVAMDGDTFRWHPIGLTKHSAEKLSSFLIDLLTQQCRDMGNEIDGELKISLDTRVEAFPGQDVKSFYREEELN